MQNLEYNGHSIEKISDNIYKIEQKGDMNVPAYVYASEAILNKCLKDKSISQIINVATLPGIVKGSFAMPDMHQGYGFPIGGVAGFDYDIGTITPGGIGFDINCGVRLLKTPLLKKDIAPKIKQIIEKIFEEIPTGVGCSTYHKLTHAELNEVLENGCSWAKEKGIGTESDIKFCEEEGHMQGANAQAVSQKAKSRGKDQLGTLGAGNHFIEIQYIDEIYDKEAAKAFGIEKDQVVYMIHCGSRGLGHQICSDYLRKIENDNPELAARLPEKDLIYTSINERTGQQYLGAMAAAANFAWTNRMIIGDTIRTIISESCSVHPEDITTVYDVAHNIAKIENHIIEGKEKKLIVHRKGATRAFAKNSKEIPKEYQSVGQPIIIPGSMGTSSYLLVGEKESMNQALGSTAHGAGREMSRHEAKKAFDPADIKKELAEQNILIQSKTDKGIAEEAPKAYKDIDEVIKVSKMEHLAKPVARLKALAVIKG